MGFHIGIGTLGGHGAGSSVANTATELMAHLAAQPNQDAIAETADFPWFQGDNFGPLNEAVTVSTSMDGDETSYATVAGDYGVQEKLHLTASAINAGSTYSFDNAGGSSETAEVWGSEDVLVAGYADNLTSQRAGATVISMGLKPLNSNFQFSSFSISIYKTDNSGHLTGDVVLEIVMQSNTVGTMTPRTNNPLDITTSDRDSLGAHFWETTLATGYTDFDVPFWMSILFKKDRVGGECLLDVETSVSPKQTVGYTANTGGTYSEPVVGFRVSDCGVTSLACWKFSAGVPRDIDWRIQEQLVAWETSQYDITISDDDIEYNAIRLGDLANLGTLTGVDTGGVALGALLNPTLNGITIESIYGSIVASGIGTLTEPAWRVDITADGTIADSAMPENVYINGVLYSKLDYGFAGTAGTQAESGYYTSGGGTKTHWAWVIVDSNSPDRSIKTVGAGGNTSGVNWIPLNVRA